MKYLVLRVIDVDGLAFAQADGHRVDDAAARRVPADRPQPFDLGGDGIPVALDGPIDGDQDRVAVRLEAAGHDVAQLRRVGHAGLVEPDRATGQGDV